MAETGEIVPKQEEIAASARKVEQEIIQVASGIKSAWFLLAGRLYTFHDQKMWESLGMESFAEWCAGPELGLSERHALKLIQLHRDLVIRCQVPQEQLRGVDHEKMLMALPAITTGKVDWKTAISDARSLSRGDMADEYSNGDKGKGFDAKREPEKKPCPTCGHWTDVEKLKGAA